MLIFELVQQSSYYQSMPLDPAKRTRGAAARKTAPHSCTTFSRAPGKPTTLQRDVKKRQEQPGTPERNAVSSGAVSRDDG